MEEEQNIEVEYVEEDDKDYDVSLLEGALFVPNMTNFVDKYKVEAIWYSAGGMPAFLIEDKGIVYLDRLISPERKLKPV